MAPRPRRAEGSRCGIEGARSNHPTAVHRTDRSNDSAAVACPASKISRSHNRDDHARVQTRRTWRQRDVADQRRSGLRNVAARGLAVIRIDALWLCATPVDMRSGTERLLAHVVHALGSAHAHHGYLFANARATRIKMLVHDGFGVWCAARRLNAGRFVWPREIDTAAPIALSQAQFDALVVGLPWQRLHEMSAITRL